MKSYCVEVSIVTLGPLIQRLLPHVRLFFKLPRGTPCRALVGPVGHESNKSVGLRGLMV